MRAEPLTDYHQSTNQANSSAPKLASAQVGSRSTLQLSPFGLISSAERRLNFEQAELTTFQEVLFAPFSITESAQLQLFPDLHNVFETMSEFAV